VDFVNFEEAKARLGKTDEQLQASIDSGELRVFRDGGDLKFRKEDIDALTGAAAPGEPAADEEADAGDTLMSIDADILFAEEEEVPADSAAETWIAADTEGVFPSEAAEPLGVEEAMAAPEAEPAPLALSPETDESSLGGVLSDEELGVGEELSGEPVIAIDAESGLVSVAGPSGASAVAPSRTRIVTLVEPPAHFTFMLGLAVVCLGLAGLGIIGLLQGSVSGALQSMASENTPLIVLVVGIVIVGIAALVGYVLDKQRSAREAIGG
jgi:hypothetical protein